MKIYSRFIWAPIAIVFAAFSPFIVSYLVKALCVALNCKFDQSENYYPCPVFGIDIFPVLQPFVGFTGFWLLSFPFAFGLALIWLFVEVNISFGKKKRSDQSS